MSSNLRLLSPGIARLSVTLIKQMTQANPLWGAPRIHGELLKLWIDISERSVSRLMPKVRNPPSQTWRTFLDNHFRELVSIDFLTVPTATFRVLYVLVVLAHDRRRVVHFNVTGHPTAAWTAQQMIEAFPEETAPRFLLRDRDQIYGEEFRRRVAGMRIEELMTAPHSPWQSPYVERLIGSIRRECLAQVEIEDQITLDSLPPAVKAEIIKQAARGKLLLVASVTKDNVIVAYEARVRFGEKVSEIRVGADGKYLGVEGDDDDDKAATNKKVRP